MDRSGFFLVTGATSGLGRATALRLARAGFDLALLGRDAEALAATAAEGEAAGVATWTSATDLARTEVLEALVDQAAASLGPVAGLVNAAATDAPGPADGLALAEWERVLAVNLTAPFLLSRAVMRHLRGTGGGLVVNVSSVAGRRGWAEASAYCATKSALTGLTQSLAAEGREHGIRVCLLYPGAMATSWGAFTPEERAASGDGTPAADADALPAETVADLVAWLATAPGRPVLNEATITPLLERGWP